MYGNGRGRSRRSARQAPPRSLQGACRLPRQRRGPGREAASRPGKTRSAPPSPADSTAEASSDSPFRSHSSSRRRTARAIRSGSGQTNASGTSRLPLPDRGGELADPVRPAQRQLFFCGARGIICGERLRHRMILIQGNECRPSDEPSRNPRTRTPPSTNPRRSSRTPERVRPEYRVHVHPW